MRHSLPLIAVLCIGMLIGWVGRDLSLVNQSFEKVSDTGSGALAQNRAFEDPAREVSPSESDIRALDEKGPARADSSPGKQRATQAQLLDETGRAKTAVQRLKVLEQALTSRQFTRAINLLAEIERNHSAEFSRARKSVARTMEGLRRSNQNTAFLELVDAYLAVYFREVDAYLRLADFHADQDQVFEAISVFQQAESFASNAGKKKTIKAAVVAFVDELSARYEREQRDYELAQIFEQLLLTDFDYPEFRFYLADLYLRENYVDSARRLLTELSSLPQWRDRAQALLLGLNNPEQVERERIDLALVREGSHYLAPLLLDGRAEAQLMIDTGASITTISRRRFAELQNRSDPQFVREQTFRTANGLAEGSIYRFQTVSFAGFELRDLEVAVLDFPTGKNSDGLLGMNILRRFRFELDQAEAVLRLSPP